MAYDCDSFKLDWNFHVTPHPNVFALACAMVKLANGCAHQFNKIDVSKATAALACCKPEERIKLMEMDTNEVRSPPFDWRYCEFFIGNETWIKELTASGHCIISYPLTDYRVKKYFLYNCCCPSEAEAIVTDSKPFAKEVVDKDSRLTKIKGDIVKLPIVKLPSEVSFAEVHWYCTNKRVFLFTAPGTSFYSDKCKRKECLDGRDSSVEISTYLCARVNCGETNGNGLAHVKGVLRKLCEVFDLIIRKSKESDECWEKFFCETCRKYLRVTRDRGEVVSRLVRHSSSDMPECTVKDFKKILWRHHKKPKLASWWRPTLKNRKVSSMAEQILQYHLIRPDNVERGLRITHYTSVESLEKMLQQAESESRRGVSLWAKPTKMLNDPNEGMELPGEEDNGNSVRYRDEGLLNGHETVTTSFSKDWDNLEMWRAYSDGKGVALTMPIGRRAVKFLQWYRCNLYWIEYDEEAFRRAKRLLDRCKGDDGTKWKGFEMLKFCYKNVRWQNEKEVRVLARVPVSSLDERRESDDNGLEKLVFFYALPSFFLNRRYVEKKGCNDKNDEPRGPCVTLGPQICLDAVESRRKGIWVQRRFRDALGYTPEVRESKHPYRSS